MMMERFWDTQSKNYDEEIQTHDEEYDRRIARTAERLMADDVVLDFGCASGEISLDIAGHVRQVYGIDFSAGMIGLAKEKAAKRGAENVTFEQTDLFDARLAGRSISAVVAFNVFHLVEDGSRTLARLNELLPKGGLLISQTPCLGQSNRVVGLMIGLAGRLGVGPSVRRFRTAELEALIAGNGFEIIESTLWDENYAVRWIAARKR